MDYKSLMGYGKKKKVTKKKPKPKVNKILESVKEEFGYVNEGPAYEYGKHIKNIEKSQKMMEKSVLALKKDLLKKGHKQEGIIISAGFYQFAEDKFNKVLKSIMDTLN
jgi:hypothetical protein|tara:strand:+ start:161 stop:484 length:324 start_codon:yes stop_codon:yes gene_type:complete